MGGGRGGGGEEEDLHGEVPGHEFDDGAETRHARAHRHPSEAWTRGARRSGLSGVQGEAGRGGQAHQPR